MKNRKGLPPTSTPTAHIEVKASSSISPFARFLEKNKTTLTKSILTCFRQGRLDKCFDQLDVFIPNISLFNPIKGKLDQIDLEALNVLLTAQAMRYLFSSNGEMLKDVENVLKEIPHWNELIDSCKKDGRQSIVSSIVLSFRAALIGAPLSLYLVNYPHRELGLCINDMLNSFDPKNEIDYASIEDQLKKYAKTAHSEVLRETINQFLSSSPDDYNHTDVSLSYDDFNKQHISVIIYDDNIEESDINLELFMETKNGSAGTLRQNKDSEQTGSMMSLSQTPHTDVLILNKSEKPSNVIKKPVTAEKINWKTVAYVAAGMTIGLLIVGAVVGVTVATYGGALPAIVGLGAAGVLAVGLSTSGPIAALTGFSIVSVLVASVGASVGGGVGYGVKSLLDWGKRFFGGKPAPRPLMPTSASPDINPTEASTSSSAAVITGLNKTAAFSEKTTESPEESEEPDEIYTRSEWEEISRQRKKEEAEKDKLIEEEKKRREKEQETDKRFNETLLVSKKQEQKANDNSKLVNSITSFWLGSSPIKASDREPIGSLSSTTNRQ